MIDWPDNDLFRGNAMIGEQSASLKARSNKYPAVLLGIVLIVFIWSGIGLHDTRLTWVLETAPFMIALPILLFTCRRFPLTSLTYTVIAIHSMVLMLGGHYSYSKVPLGFWMQDWFGWTRNNYDKIGHFMQGLGPLVYTREIVVRTTPLKRGKMLQFLCLAVPMAISALYEIVEWLTAVIIPGDSEAFLGTQGYFWDTQTDMFFCLIGAVAGLLFLTKLHNKSALMN
jgi:putative membrane protein